MARTGAQKLPTLDTPLDDAALKARVYPLSEEADRALRETLASHVPYIEEVSRYIIFSGGKRLRPVLFMLCAAAAGGEPDPRLAAIFEYLHAATLLHDDVVDEAGLRRGRPAARVRYGNDSVILVGDFLFSKSYSLAVEVGDHRFVTALTRCTTTMAEGQVLELLATDQLELDYPGYLEVIRAKTAVLIAAACEMGAIHAGAPDAVVEALYDYGMALGLAFQMVDDALDYVGTAHEFGKPVGHDLVEGKITLPFIHVRDTAPAKPVGHDLAEGKITLPFIHVRDTAPARVRERLLSLAREGRQRPEAVEEAKELVVAHGGVEATYARAAEYARAAQEALGRVPELGGDREVLLSLPGYVLRRRH